MGRGCIIGAAYRTPTEVHWGATRGCCGRRSLCLLRSADSGTRLSFGQFVALTLEASIMDTLVVRCTPCLIDLESAGMK